MGPKRNNTPKRTPPRTPIRAPTRRPKYRVVRAGTVRKPKPKPERPKPVYRPEPTPVRTPTFNWDGVYRPSKPKKSKGGKKRKSIFSTFNNAVFNDYTKEYGPQGSFGDYH